MTPDLVSECPSPSSKAQSRDAILIAVVPPAAPFLPQIVYANTAFPTLMGYAPAEIIGATLACVCGPETDPTVLAQSADAAENGRSFLTEMCQYREDGTPVWVELRMFPVTASDAGQAQVALSRRDLTTERELQRAHDVATVEWTRSNRALQEFASVASHDLQEPLRKIERAFHGSLSALGQQVAGAWPSVGTQTTA